MDGVKLTGKDYAVLQWKQILFLPKCILGSTFIFGCDFPASYQEIIPVD